MAQFVIGAQMYTLRDYLKTPADVAKSCARLKKIGYQAVQVSGLGPIDTAELVKILDGEGLTCAATHVSLEQMQNTSAVLDYHRALRCQYTAIGGFGWEVPAKAQWQQFVDTYNQVARTLTPQGLQVGYHNHSHELARFPDDPAQSPLEFLLAKLDPQVWFELDTYWISHGGGDPANWIDRLAGRIPCIHFKDMIRTCDKQAPQKMCEVGSGNLNWPRIIESCKKTGVKWYLVERDSGDLDPFESLKISLENLKAMGLH